MATIKTAQGFSIETFPIPPARFDLAAADPTERTRYGLSIFADDQALQSRWQSKLTGYQFIQPLFSARTIAPKTFTSLVTPSLSSWSTLTIVSYPPGKSPVPILCA
jgi:hypothetical protein